MIPQIATLLGGNNNLTRLAVIAVAGAVGLVVLHKAATGIMERIESHRADRALETVTKYDKRNLSYDTALYTQWATALHNAMKDVGTNDSQVMDIVAKMRTRDDWNALIKAFGMREYGNFGAPAWGDGDKANLIQWLNWELSKSDMAKVNTALSEVGITL